MANPIVSPGFEVQPPWQLVGAAEIVSAPDAHGGGQYLRLLGRRGVLFESDTGSTCYQIEVPVTPGKLYPKRAWTRGDAFGPTALAVVFSQASVPDEEFFLAAPLGAGWHLWEAGTFIPVDPFVTISYVVPLPVSNGLGWWDVDDVALGLDEDETLMRSTCVDFMNRLKMLLEGIDPNFGKVYVTTKRWPTLVALEEGGAFRITSVGALDDADRIGRDVTRFWWMQPQIDVEPLTNGSAEYRSTVLLTGFYQHEDGDGQVAALNQAAIEILDAINTRTTELTTLNTGDGYLGFLGHRPRMVQPVQPGKLEEPGVQGNVVQLQISFAEEVSYI